MPIPIIAAAIGVGGTLLAGSQADDAAQKTADAQSQASANALALQQQQFATTQANNAPYLTTGAAANNVLAQQYGLTNGGAPVADYAAYLQANPDVAAWAAADGDPSNDQAQAATQYQEYGQKEGRPLTMEAPQGPASAYGARPDAPAAPTFGAAPTYGSAEQTNVLGNAPSASSYLNGAGFTADPGYQFTLNEALRAINAQTAAPGGAGFFSGDRGKELQGRAADLANQTYNDWYNRQQTAYQDASSAYNTAAQANLGQYNTDKTTGLQQYDVDRNVLNQNYNTDYTNAINQQNTDTNNLFKIAGNGQASANQQSAAGQNYANASTNVLNTNAAATGNAAQQIGSNNASAVNNIFGVGQNLLANYGKSTPNQYTGDISSMAGLY